MYITTLLEFGCKITYTKMVGSLGNDPSELLSVGFTVRTVSLTVYLPKKIEPTAQVTHFFNPAQLQMVSYLTSLS
jgi:hypothetical protein